MQFFENLKNILNKQEHAEPSSPIHEIPKLPKLKEENDAIWILNNIDSPKEINYFDENTIIGPTPKEKTKEEITEDIPDLFIKEISKGPGKYNVQILENCIFKSEEVNISPSTSQIIINLLEEILDKLEKKGASNHWKEDYTDTVRDLSCLFLSPYTHSRLLGTNEKKINSIRTRLKNLDTKFC